MKRRRNFTFWISLTAFAVFSALAGLRLLYGFDLWTLDASQTWTTIAFDRIGGLFSTLGGIEVTVPAFAVLVIWLFVTNRRTLAIRLSAAMLVTSLVELAMKMWLPQVPMPEDAARTTGFSPVLDVPYSYPYPSGHMLRSMLLFGAIFLLWSSKVARALIVLAVAGMALSRVYLGVHWASDVIGGVLLGIAGLVWAFGKQSACSGQPSAKTRSPKYQKDM
ncbi:MAG: phosphatase PAP2 family protein [Rubrobacteraceae bacterium]